MLCLLIQASCTALLWEDDSPDNVLRGTVKHAETRVYPDQGLLFEFRWIGADKDLESQLGSGQIQFLLSTTDASQDKQERRGKSPDTTFETAHVDELRLEGQPVGLAGARKGALTLSGALPPTSASGKLSYRSRKLLSASERDRLDNLSFGEHWKVVQFAFFDREGKPLSWKDPAELSGKEPISVALRIPDQEPPACFRLPTSISSSREQVWMELSPEGRLRWSVEVEGAWTQSSSASAQSTNQRVIHEDDSCPVGLIIPHRRSLGDVLWRIPVTVVTIPVDFVVLGTGLVVFVLPITLITGEWPGH